MIIDLSKLLPYLRPTTLAALVYDCVEAKATNAQDSTMLDAIAIEAAIVGRLNMGFTEFNTLVNES